jgi:hypothetical protein
LSAEQAATAARRVVASRANVSSTTTPVRALMGSPAWECAVAEATLLGLPAAAAAAAATIRADQVSPACGFYGSLRMLSSLLKSLVRVTEAV